MAQNTKAQNGSTSSRAWDGLTPPLSEWILDAVSSMGFEKMTPVQASTIPLFLGNKDVVVEAVTGSGKTMAFLIPIVEKLLRNEQLLPRHHVGAIVISPTRELATQIHSVLVSLLGFHPPSMSALQPPESDIDEPNPFQHSVKVVTQLLVGGAQSPAQDLSLFLSNSPNILIGTPGRLLELLSSPYVHCPQSSFEVLVLDEADRLLDLGFKDDLQRILGRLPKQRRTGLFSASVSEAVDQIIRVGLRNPVRISVKVKSESGAMDKRTPASLQMSYLLAQPKEKIPALFKLLDQVEPRPQKAIIYLSTCAAVDYFQHVLPQFTQFTVIPLHGKYPPQVREKNFKRFSESLTPTTLLTTDVAARGLDIPLVDLVIQVDPPSDPKVFLHRCGRAGRAGRRGLAVTFLTPGREEDYVSFLAARKTPITPLEVPKIEVSESEVDSITQKIRETVISDRAVHDKAQKAFVSWVRSYSKHQASSIFMVSDLDWHELGDAWGLLRLPRMPELKHWKGDPTLGLGVDFDTYQYKDSAREKHRLETLNNPEPRKPKRREENMPWSKTRALKAEKKVKKEKRHAKKEHLKNEKLSEDQIKEREELTRMIEQVKKQNAEQDADAWEGFT